MVLWGVILSKILANKIGSGSGSRNDQTDLKHQQDLFEQQRKEEEKRQQRFWIAIGVSIIVLIGGILTYKAFQQKQSNA